MKALISIITVVILLAFYSACIAATTWVVVLTLRLLGVLQ